MTKALVAPTVPRVAKSVPNPRVLWIQFWLAKRGYTQNDVVDESGASKSMVSLVFSGDRASGDKYDAIREATVRLTGKSVKKLFDDPLP